MESIRTINSVLVKLEKTREDEKNGFYFDPGFNPEEHARIYGEVVGIPSELTGKFSHIDPIVRIGDRIYFHYLIVDGEPIFENTYKVEYNSIFCIARDGEIIPVGDWFLCQPIYDDDSVTDIDVDGSTVKGILTKSGLVATVNPDHSAIKAKVTHIVDFPEVDPGEIVYLQPGFEFKNNIEGTEYFLCEKEYILGK